MSYRKKRAEYIDDIGSDRSEEYEKPRYRLIRPVFEKSYTMTMSSTSIKQRRYR